MALDATELQWLEQKIKREAARAAARLRRETDERFTVLRLAVAEALAHLSFEHVLDWHTVETSVQTLLLLQARSRCAREEGGALISVVETRLRQLGNGARGAAMPGHE